MYPIALRDELYRLFISSLRLSKKQDFQWLELFVQHCREARTTAVALSELSRMGRSERHLDQRGLMDLLSSCSILRLAGSEIELGTFDGHPLAYLEDRLPRYQAALKELLAAPHEADAVKRDVRAAAALFNQGLFFDCHEYLEPCWKAAKGELKTALQGLIQAGAGLHKFELGSREGCAQLLKASAEKLEKSGSALPFDVSRLAGQLSEARAALASGRFSLGQAPKIGVPA